jgi:hypothetical protein
MFITVTPRSLAAVEDPAVFVTIAKLHETFTKMLQYANST